MNLPPRHHVEVCVPVWLILHTCQNSWSRSFTNVSFTSIPRNTFRPQCKNLDHDCHCVGTIVLAYLNVYIHDWDLVHIYYLLFISPGQNKVGSGVYLCACAAAVCWMFSLYLSLTVFVCMTINSTTPPETTITIVYARDDTSSCWLRHSLTPHPVKCHHVVKGRNSHLDSRV